MSCGAFLYCCTIHTSCSRIGSPSFSPGLAFSLKRLLPMECAPLRRGPNDPPERDLLSAVHAPGHVPSPVPHGMAGPPVRLCCSGNNLDDEERITIPLPGDQRGSKVTTMPYFRSRSWVRNIDKRMRVLTGSVKIISITMNSGTYQLLIWQGWWSAARWWRKREEGE